jgi:hypothetical protein
VTDYSDFDEARLKHLDMLQAVIGRLGTNGFVIKGWAITVAGAFFGFAVSERDWRLALASLIPTVLFWFLDSYFLRAERLFRCLFGRVRRTNTTEPFFLDATGAEFVASLATSERQVASLPSAAWRPTLRLLYGGLVIAAIVVALLVAGLDNPS